MATRIPLIVNAAANQIQELPIGDSLTGISTLTATEFIGETSSIGVSTATRSVIGLASVTELVVSGVSTFSSTVTVDNGGVNVTGVVTATNGFSSGNGAVQITVSGSTLTFTVAGVGSTILTLS